MTSDECMSAAAHVRALHKVPGIIIISLESGQTQFGLALAEIDKDTLMRQLPRMLREMAGKIEAQAREATLIVKTDKGAGLA